MNKRKVLDGVRVTAVRGKKEIVLFEVNCFYDIAIPKGFNIVAEPLYKVAPWLTTERTGYDSKNGF